MKIVPGFYCGGNGARKISLYMIDTDFFFFFHYLDLQQDGTDVEPTNTDD